MSLKRPIRNADNTRRSENGNVDDPALNNSVLDTLRKRFNKIAPEVLIEIIETYMHEASIMISQIEKGIKETDNSSVAHAAHTLKSSSALLGADSLSSLCANLESIALAGDLHGGEEIASQIHLEFSRVRAAMEDELYKPG